METYKKRIDECTDLESLFLIWKEAHQEEKYFDETLPKNKDGEYPEDKKKFAKNWTNDGYLSCNTENIDILFILKEPNEENAIEETKKLTKQGFAIENVYSDNKDFWIKNGINTGKIIPRRIRKAAIELLENETTEENWMQKSAVININKRGGYKFCDPKQLLNYIKIYKQFILKQIEIINPKIIVFMCGNADENGKVIKELNIDAYKIFYCYHPSYWRINDDCYIKKLKEQLYVEKI